jgi:hypothetical protein
MRKGAILAGLALFATGCGSSASLTSPRSHSPTNVIVGRFDEIARDAVRIAGPRPEAM